MEGSIRHAQAVIETEPVSPVGTRLHVQMLDPAAHIWQTTCETTLPRSVVEALLAAHGPAGLCYVIGRIEDPATVERDVRRGILAFVPPEEFAGKRILDFGCGSGASTLHLARFFPESEIVGVDLVGEYIDAARLLALHLGLERVSFVEAESRDGLADLGEFDFVVLNAVYEHLLPDERRSLMPQLWATLAPGGTLFVISCPHRWYPLEYHTTALPLLNYLPDRLALHAARSFAGLERRGISRDARWEDLLRGGIRGGTDREILGDLDSDANALPLKPLEHADSVDLWYSHSMERNPLAVKRAMRLAFKGITKITGSTFTPDLTLAVRKS